MNETPPPRIVINPNQRLSAKGGDVVGRLYHLTRQISDSYIEDFWRADFTGDMRTYASERLGETGFVFIDQLFREHPEVVEVCVYSHSAGVYAHSPIDQDRLSEVVLKLLRFYFFGSDGHVEVIQGYDEALCHPEDTRNHRGLAPA